MEVNGFKGYPGKLLINCLDAMIIAALVRLGIRNTRYHHIFMLGEGRQTSLTFPREKNVVSKSQCPNACLLLTDLGRFEMN